MARASLSITAERNAALLAHLSALLTLVVGLYTGGLGAALALVVPLGLYLYLRQRAPYAAYHALQSTVFQAAGAILYVAIAVVVVGVTALGWLVAAALSVVLVGLALLPPVLAVTLLAVIVLVGLPLAGLACSLRGAYLAYQGAAFEYPLVGRLVARAMGSLEPPRQLDFTRKQA